MPGEGGESEGLWYSNKDRVRQETLWRQRIKEETHRASLVPGANFQLNLIRPTPAIDAIRHSHNRIELVSEKEHASSPGIRSQIGDLDEGSFEVKTIRHLGKRPTEKWDLPMTSGQDIGWLLAKPARADHMMPTPPDNEAPVMHSARSARGGSSSSRDWAASGNSGNLTSRSGNAPRLTDGKWVPKDEAELLTNPAEHLPDIHRLNTPRWNRGKAGSDVGEYFETYLAFLKRNPFKKDGAAAASSPSK